MANAVHSDFRMVFDLVSSSALKEKQGRYALHKQRRFEGIWLHCWTQRVLISSTNFNGKHLLAASLMDLYWDEHYLLTLLNYLDDTIECTPNKIVSEIKMEGAVNTLESRITFSYSLMDLRNEPILGMLGSSTEVTVHRVFHLGWKNLGQWHRLARKQTGR